MEFIEGLKRKCNYCGKYLYIDKDNIGEAIYYDKKTYHSKCFLDYCKEKQQSNRKNVVKKWTDISDNIKAIKEDTYNHFINAIAKDEVYKFIQQAYDINVIPTNVWQKISDIYTGKFKGMMAGIPPIDLLNMWAKKIDSFNKIAEQNRARGKIMNPAQRISYDLSILINKYDSYLKWKEKQKILESEKQNSKSQFLLTSKITNVSPSPKNEEQDDILDLVDDIFG